MIGVLIEVNIYVRVVRTHCSMSSGGLYESRLCRSISVECSVTMPAQKQKRPMAI